MARTWRIQWFVRGLGHRMSFAEAFTLNAFGEAACGLTPLRIAGEPARLGGLLRARVPATAAFVAISVEVLAAWPVIIGVAAWLGWRYAPDWWTVAGPRLHHTFHSARYWVAGIVVLSLLVWFVARPHARSVVRNLRRPIRRVMVYWRRMPLWAVLASIPCTLVNVVGRVAILPVLLLTLPSHPPLGSVAVGSFALLYSQMVLPTPSGVGAVDLGFLGGAAGDLGDDRATLLFAWRLYSTGIGVLLGVGLALRIYGWQAVRSLLFRRTAGGDQA